MVEHVGDVVAIKDGLRVIDCYTCHYAHLYPLPNVQEIEVMYADDKFYTPERFKKWFEGESKENLGGMWNASYEYQARLLNKKLPVIDVGCGVGWFGRWWERYMDTLPMGVEPSLISRRNKVMTHVAMSKQHLDTQYKWGIKSGNQTYLSANVRMSLVLEHIPNPIEFISQYVPYLGASGKILIKVPNEFNPLQRRIRKKCGDFFVDKTHMIYLTPSSLRFIMQQAGLRVTHTSTTFPMELAQLLGWRYVGDERMGDRVHHWRLDLEKKLGWRAFTLYKVLYKTMGWGRELIIVGEAI